MALLERVRRQLDDAPTGYECGLCGHTFDREPINCPACGNTRIERSG